LEAEEKKVFTIVLKLTDPETFNVECDIELGRLQLMRVMLLEALRTVEKLLQDQDAIQFADRMSRAQMAAAAMRKGKGPLNI
jgi:hypothetical protein